MANATNAASDALAAALILVAQQHRPHHDRAPQSAYASVPLASARSSTDVDRALASYLSAAAASREQAQRRLRHRQQVEAAALAAARVQRRARQHRQANVQAKVLLREVQEQYLQQHLQQQSRHRAKAPSPPLAPAAAVQQQQQIPPQAQQAQAPQVPQPRAPQPRAPQPQPPPSNESSSSTRSGSGNGNENKEKKAEANNVAATASTSFSAARTIRTTMTAEVPFVTPSLAVVPSSLGSPRHPAIMAPPSPLVVRRPIETQEAAVVLVSSTSSSEEPSRRRTRGASISAVEGYSCPPESQWWSPTSASAATTFSACKGEAEEGDDINDAEKRHLNEKREANRISAKLCRHKKKIYVADLCAENAELRRKVRILRAIPEWIVAFDPAGTVSFSTGGRGKRALSSPSADPNRPLFSDAAEDGANGMVGASFWDVLSAESAAVIKAAFMDALAVRRIGAERKRRRNDLVSSLVCKIDVSVEEEDRPTPLAGGGSIAVQLIDPRNGGQEGGEEKTVSLKGVVCFDGDVPECVCNMRELQSDEDNCAQKRQHQSCNGRHLTSQSRRLLL